MGTSVVLSRTFWAIAVAIGLAATSAKAVAQDFGDAIAWSASRWAGRDGSCYLWGVRVGRIAAVPEAWTEANAVPGFFENTGDNAVRISDETRTRWYSAPLAVPHAPSAAAGFFWTAEDASLDLIPLVCDLSEIAGPGWRRYWRRVPADGQRWHEAAAAAELAMRSPVLEDRGRRALLDAAIGCANGHVGGCARLGRVIRSGARAARVGIDADVNAVDSSASAETGTELHTVTLSIGGDPLVVVDADRRACDYGGLAPSPWVEPKRWPHAGGAALGSPDAGPPHLTAEWTLPGGKRASLHEDFRLAPGTLSGWVPRLGAWSEQLEFVLQACPLAGAPAGYAHVLDQVGAGRQPALSAIVQSWLVLGNSPPIGRDARNWAACASSTVLSACNHLLAVPIP